MYRKNGISKEQEVELLKSQVDQLTEEKEQLSKQIEEQQKQWIKERDNLERHLQEQEINMDRLRSENQEYENEHKTMMERITRQTAELENETACRKKLGEQLITQHKELTKQLTMATEELNQVRVTKKIEERIPTSGIFRAGPPTMTKSPYKTETMKEKETPSFTTSTSTFQTTYQPDNLTSKSSTINDNIENISSGTPTTRITRTDAPTYVDNRFTQGPTPPKLPTFDGKSDWKPYYMQFLHIANKYNWSDQTRLDKLIECLREKATKFYSTRPPSVQNNWRQLVDKMNQRFGNKDLPYTIRRQLQDVRQNMDETLEEFAERVLEMATDGYYNAPEPVVETIAVDAFLKGCTDKKAVLFAMEKNPTTMDIAVQCVKSTIHNQRVVLGRKPEVKRVTFEEEEDDSDTDMPYEVRAVKRFPVRSSSPNNPGSPNKSSVKQRLDQLETKVEKEVSAIKVEMGGMKTDISKILNILTTRRSGSSSPSRSPVRQNEPYRCFTCNEEGHFASRCPRKNLSPVKSNKLTSPKKEQKDLNK